ncbi:alpha/beta fold hydrolase [Amycolatopsis sp. NPDC005003]
MNSLAAIQFGLKAAAAVSPGLAGKLAFPLFVRTGARAPVRPAEQAVHDAATTERLHVDGKELAVYSWGESDRRVLLMHGFDSRASSWAALVPGILDRGMSAVAFDSFGHGASEGDRSTIVDTAAAARAVADKYGPFHAIVAHSFGGLCAYHTIRTGVPVNRLVTIAAICDFGYLPVLFTKRLGLGSKVVDDLRRRSEQYFLPEQDIWNRFSATYQAADQTWPLLVIHDDKDKEIDVAQGRKIASTYEQAEFVETSGLGHRRILADSEVVGRTLEFIARDETG